MHAREQQASNRRLDSWKEIAAFFGRDERTVKRWEKERALPVHRVPGGSRSGVFAYTAELSEWLKDPVPAASESSDGPASLVGGNGFPSGAIREGDSARSKQVRAPWVASANPKSQVARVLGLLLAILLGFLILKHQIPRQPTAASAINNVPTARQPKPEAEELYLKGRYFWNKRTPEDLNKALDLFTQAIVRDPGYAQAYVGLADCYNLMREYSVMPANEAYPRALAAAKKAVELDDNSAEAHNSLAFATFYWTWDAATAEREFKHAIELNPGYVAAHHWYATFLMVTRRYPEAISEIEIARKLDPSSTPIMADKGFILYLAGQPDQGIALLKQIHPRSGVSFAASLPGGDRPCRPRLFELLGGVEESRVATPRPRGAGSRERGGERLRCRWRPRNVGKDVAGAEEVLSARQVAGLCVGADIFAIRRKPGSHQASARGL
jgi:tetratricopeptide (TPR) repeat protein